MVTLISFIAILAAALLGWNLYRRFAFDHIAEINNRRRASSRIVGRGEFVDGNRHLEVALALTPTTFHYENADMQASFDLQFIREIEYDTELATGTSFDATRVLRLRSDSQMFEFVLPADTVANWQSALPPRTEKDATVEPKVTSAN